MRQNGNKAKYKLLKIFIVIFMAISFLDIAYILVADSLTKKYDITTGFLNTDTHIADSLLKTLTLEEKINLVIFTDYENNNTNYGGFAFHNFNDDIFHSYKKILDTAKILPFTSYLSEIVLPHYEVDSFAYPDIQTLLSTEDTNLLSEYANLCFIADSIAGQNMLIFNLLDNFYDTINTDTSRLNIINKLLKITEKRYSETNLLIGLNLVNFNTKDSVSRAYFLKFYKEFFQNGGNTLLLTNRNLFDELNLLSFNGLLIAEDSIFTTPEDFLASDIDMIFVHNSPEDSKNNLLNTVMSKNKYKKELNKKVKKILLAKTWLSNTSIEKSSNLENLLKNRDTKLLFKKIYKNSIILLKNKENFLPVNNINATYECLIFSDSSNFTEFQNIIKKYNNAVFYTHSSESLNFLQKITKNKQKNYILVFDNIRLDEQTFELLTQADTSNKLIIINIRDTVNLKKLLNLKHIIYASQNNSIIQSYLAQAIFGGISIAGHLPFSVDTLIAGYGLYVPKTRLGYDMPEMAGLDSAKLAIIDSIAMSGIRIGAYPGCQVFVAKNGIIVWDKSYGWTNYAHSKRVTHNILYDIASVTKVVATTLATMKMYETGRLSLDKPIGKYFKDTHIEYDRIKPDTVVMIDTLNINEIKEWKKKIVGKDTTWLDDTLLQTVDTVIYKLTPSNNIFKVTPRQLLMHKSGIQPAMPILKLMLLDDEEFRRIRDVIGENDSDSIKFDKNALRKMIYSTHYIKDSAEIRVAAGMYLRKAYFDTLWRDTKALPVMSNKEYVYSDVNMILLQQTIDTINGYGINRYVERNFYYPLGLKYITYKPLKKFSRYNIAPTENDRYWRMQVIQGDVHDPSAALLGGVAGNAGVFSNAYSLGVIGQMLLNGGAYGGRRYLSQATINMFTQTQPDSYRGLGFDKWGKRQIIAPEASHNTFGHTGFTGTCIWVDPDNDIVFVFLSNRVHPKVTNWRLNSYKIRNNIHQAIYRAIKK